VQEGFEPLAALRVREHARAHAGSVQTSVGIENGFPECRYDRGERWLSRLHDFACDDVRIDQYCTKFAEHRCDEALAARNAAGQSDTQHNIALFRVRIRA
jgi:hypothetical protein